MVLLRDLRRQLLFFRRSASNGKDDYILIFNKRKCTQKALVHTNLQPLSQTCLFLLLKDRAFMLSLNPAYLPLVINSKARFMMFLLSLSHNLLYELQSQCRKADLNE